MTGKKSPTLRDITIDILLDECEQELAQLGLLNRSIGTYDTALKTLCDNFGTDAGFSYFGALCAKITYPSRETIVTASGIHPRTLDRRIKKVLSADLPQL